MKNFILIISLLFCFACQESEFTLYEGGELIKFYNRIENKVDPSYYPPRAIDSTAFTFIFELPSMVEFQIPVVVKISGQSAAVDRSFTLVADESSTAVSDVHYKALPNSFTLRKGLYEDTVYVTLMRDVSLKTETVRLSLTLIDGGDFSVGVENKDIYVVNFSDKVDIPVWWSGFVPYVYGDYSEVKYRVLVKVSGEIDHSSFGWGYMREFTRRANIYFKENPNEFAHDEFGDVLDENGLPLVWGVLGG